MDHYYLNLAYHLALQNAGKTSPNPSVGAVIVKDRQILTTAFHPGAGEPHAEVLALRKAGSAAKDATLYCSLEPCAHQGKTPPCVNAIKEAGIKRVVFSAIDQNPMVNGKGQEQLRAAGIKVDQIELPAVKYFYAPFFHSILKQRPHVIAKVGTTANGIISPADRNSRWITNEWSLIWVHHLRAQCDAVVVGADTVILDRPHLTVRTPGIIRKPTRIVLDSRLKLNPEDCSLLESDSPVLICCAETASQERERLWRERKNVEILRFQGISTLLPALFKRGLSKILVEGGQKIFTLFHTSGFIDEYVLMIAPRLLTGKHFLNILGGPEQSLSETQRYQVDPPQELDGDVIVRLRKNV
jgi:diaminohydroxyphosphoribosylaminopyrimidine deaminase / 5-amino-6-(5-phosphoribosylamino)uracil reductase